MWLKFTFTEKSEWWEEPNVQICYIGEHDWNNTAFISWEIIELTDTIAKNLLSIINSTQILIWSQNVNCSFDEYIEWFCYLAKWKFHDCHSFAYSLTIWETYSIYWIPSEWLLKKKGLINNWTIIKWEQINDILLQGDLLIPRDTEKWAHSIVYLWLIKWNHSFISCFGKEGYVNYNWIWNREFNKEIFEEIAHKSNWEIYVKDWYRKGWFIGINTIDEIFDSYHNIKSFTIYRKNSNTLSPS